MSNEVTIREAVPGDAEKIIEFVQKLTEEPGIHIALAPGEFNISASEEERLLIDYAESENSVYLVAEIDGEIIAILNCRGGKRLAIRHMVELGMSVAEGWRGKGVGSQLMASAIEWAKQTGIVSRIELSVFERNERAIRLYRKFGFVVEGRRRKAIYREGEYQDSLLMGLLL